MIRIFGFKGDFFPIFFIDSFNQIRNDAFHLPQGSDILVLEHTMYCFVVDTTVLRFSVSVIIPVVNDDDDDDDRVSPSEFTLFQLPSLLFFLLFSQEKNA